MSQDNPLNPEVGHLEAPASWNTRYIDPQGFECQLTLRCETGHELLEKAQGAIAFLLKNGCKPSTKNSFHLPDGNGSQGGATSNLSSGNGDGNGNSSTSWCPIHQVEMRKWEKNGRVWYSHQVNGEWCTGKAKRK